MGPFHHGMARPRFADGGDGLLIWRVTTNVLNKQSLTATRGGPTAWEVGEGLTTPNHKKPACYEMSLWVVDLDGLFGTS
jgi:hypothetical protein